MNIIDGVGPGPRPEASEAVKTGIVALTQDLGDKALAGEILGMVITTVGPDGIQQVSFIGQNGWGALGMLETAKDILKRSVLAMEPER